MLRCLQVAKINQLLRFKILCEVFYGKSGWLNIPESLSYITSCHNSVITHFLSVVSNDWWSLRGLVLLTNGSSPQGRPVGPSKIWHKSSKTPEKICLRPENSNQLCVCLYSILSFFFQYHTLTEWIAEKPLWTVAQESEWVHQTGSERKEESIWHT